MEKDMLKEDSSINIWLNELCVTKNVNGNYLDSMHEYTEFTGKNPNDLLCEAKAEIEQGLLINERGVNAYLKGFQGYLRDRGFSPLTIKLYMIGVRSFYSVHHIDIPTGNRAKPFKGNNEIPTRGDLKSLIEYCDPLETAIVLVGASSGLTSNQIINLRVSHFWGGYDSQTEITTLRLCRQSTGANYITFLTPEASNSVIDYLSYRDHQQAQRVLSHDGYLFIRRQVPDEYAETGNEECRKMNERTLAGIYHRISEKLRKNSSKENVSYITPHSVRKFFHSTLLNNCASSNDVEFWMGYAVNSAERVYRSDESKQRQIYAKYIPFLTVSKP